MTRKAGPAGTDQANPEIGYRNASAATATRWPAGVCSPPSETGRPRTPGRRRVPAQAGTGDDIDPPKKSSPANWIPERAPGRRARARVSAVN